MRNPYLIALVVAGCLLGLTALVLHYGLTEDVLGYPEYDVAEVVSVSIWTAVTGIGAVVAFVGATILAGVSWRARASASHIRATTRVSRSGDAPFTNS
jgi:hypothetical protein